jgi:hypothetical protein
MKFRRRQRWLRRFAIVFAFATAAVAGKVSPSWAKADDGGVRDIPYVTGVAPSGDEIAIANAITERKIAAAESVHDPFLSDINVRQGESLGGPDGTQPLMTKDDWTVVPYLSHGILSAPAATRPDDKAVRFSPVNPPVISYLSHGMGNAGDVGARPDDRADRFTPGMVASPAGVEVAGDTRDWSSPLTLGLGLIALGLALGLAFGFARRPRLAL